MGLMSEVESPHWLQRDTRIAEDDCGAERGLQPGSHPAAHVAAIGVLDAAPATGRTCFLEDSESLIFLLPTAPGLERHREVHGGALAGGSVVRKSPALPRVMGLFWSRAYPWVAGWIPGPIGTSVSSPHPISLLPLPLPPIL